MRISLPNNSDQPARLVRLAALGILVLKHYKLISGKFKKSVHIEIQKPTPQSIIVLPSL